MMQSKSMAASTQRYDVSVDQMDQFGHLTNEISAAEAQEEQNNLDLELSTFIPRDQGFFRNMVTKLGRAELSHARWIVGREGELKICAFTDDERYIMIVM